jgi:hypothetical protein
MQRFPLLSAVLIAALSALAPGAAQAAGLARLYILNCGEGVAGDISRWSPGVNVGQAMPFVDNRYRLKQAQGWLLGDTGVPDAIATMPDGQKPAHPVTKLDGDKDVFGDGSVTILATPGHTPGHQSLLVKLPKTGVLVLSGDAVHFQANWDHRRVPANNGAQEQTKASMECIRRGARGHVEGGGNRHNSRKPATGSKRPPGTLTPTLLPRVLPR